MPLNMCFKGKENFDLMMETTMTFITNINLVKKLLDPVDFRAQEVFPPQPTLTGFGALLPSDASSV